MIGYALAGLLLIVIIVASFFGVAFAIVLIDRSLDRVFAAHRRGMDRVRAVSPHPCRSCGAVGWHDQGCGVLDRLDARRVHA